MATFGNNFMNSKASTDVNVVGFAGNALDGILKAIQETKEATNDVRKRLEDNEDNQRKSDNVERVASVASERRQRAANAAVFGKIDKGFNAIGTLTDTLKDIGKKLLDMIGDMAKQSLRSYDENTKNMRKQFLTTDQIKYNLLQGDKAKEALSKMGIKVNSNETKSIISELVNAGVDTKNLTDKQIAAITMMNKTMGTDVKTALSLVKTSKDPEEIIKMAVQASDITGRETTAKLMQSVNESWFARYAQSVGGTEKAISEFQKVAQNLDASLGDYGLSADSQKSLIETAVKISSGQIEKVKQDEIANMLAISGDAMKSPEKLVEGIQNMITRTDLSKEDKLARLRVLDGVEGINQEFITSLQNAIVASDNGEYKKKNIRSEGENKDAINQAQQGGKLGGIVDSIMTSVNTATSGLFDGGIFGSLSAELDEMFGGNMTMEEVVSGGFKVIISLLTGLVMSDFIKGGFNSLKNCIGSALSLVGLGNSMGDALDLADAADMADGPDGKKKGKGKGGSRKGPRVRGGGKLGRAVSGIKNVAQAGTKSGGTLAKVGSGIGKGALRAGGALGKGALKAVPVVGAVAGVGLTGYEIYDAMNWEAESVASESSSKEFKEYEKQINQQTKNAKIAGAAITGASTLGAMAVGAAIGSAVPIVGTAIGAVVGASVGVVTSAITDSIEKVNQTEIAIKNVEDLKASIAELDEAIANESDTNRKKELIEAKEQALLELEAATKNNIATMVSHFNDKNEDHAEKADAMTQIREMLDASNAESDRLKKELQAAKDAGKTNYEINKIQSALDAANKQKTDLSQALTGLAGGEFKVEEGESLEDAVARIAADVRGDGWFDTSEDVELEAAKSMDKLEEFLKRQSLDKLTNGVLHEALDDLKLQDADAIAQFVKESNLGAGLSEKAIKDLTGEVVKMAKGDEAFQKWQKQQAEQPTDINLVANAAGGIYSSFTPAAVGEAGKEAVIPLERPDDMKRVLNSLSPYEKFKLLKVLISKNTGNITWDTLADVLLNTLGVGKPSGLTSGKVNVTELSNRIIEGAAAQKGHSYTEMVCNQMVEAALKYAGFIPPTTGVVTKHFNHPNMHLVLNDPVNGISPNDPALVPGMIMFSHPFTQAEADALNRLKGGKRKAGDPGHMGIYAGNGLWWNSTSSKKFKDYSTGKAIDSTASGVALTKPFTKGTYKLYAAGYYDGMFDSSEISRSRVSNNIPYEPSINRAQGILSDTEINDILETAGLSNTTAIKQYIEQAKQLIGGTDNKNEIIAVLLEIARYLKGIASAPVNKPQMMPVTRPYTPSYGT